MQKNLTRYYRAPLLFVDFLFTQLPVLAQKTPKLEDEPSSPWTTSNWFWLGGAVLVTYLFVRVTKPKSQKIKDQTHPDKPTHYLTGRVRKLMGSNKSAHL